MPVLSNHAISRGERQCHAAAMPGDQQKMAYAGGVIKLDQGIMLNPIRIDLEEEQRKAEFEEAKHIAEDMGQILEMQKDMAIQVHQDQEQFDQITANVDEADKSVEFGTEDLEKAVAIRDGLNRRRCYALIIAILALGASVGFFYLFHKHEDSQTYFWLGLICLGTSFLSCLLVYCWR